MKLVTFKSGSDAHVGAIVGDRIVDLTAGGLTGTVRDLVVAGTEKAEAILDGGKAPTVALATAELLAPLMPGKTLCCGVNYKAHADENPNAKMPEEPFFFAKLPSSIVGNDAPVSKGRTAQLDFEVEFAVVIGKRLSRAKEADVMPALFGYTLLNDLSARDVQFKDNQITLGKNFDGFAPIGPCIVTADEMTDPNNVGLRTRLNGKVMQNGNTADWLFPLPRLLSFLTQTVTLEPGDVVSTGTPAGVGFFHTPQAFMNPGDVIEIQGDGIGTLRNTIVA
jgi:2-keto-4-pentenoate hydratase/2-oxohepta-3-ene-1,7-dioic acid hydratase in catechol pathway